MLWLVLLASHPLADDSSTPLAQSLARRDSPAADTTARDAATKPPSDSASPDAAMKRQSAYFQSGLLVSEAVPAGRVLSKVCGACTVDPTPPEVYPAACSLGLLWLFCAQLSSRNGWDCKGALYSAASTARASRGALPLRAKWERGGHHVTRNRTKYCMGASRALPDGPQRPGFQEDPCTSHDWVTIFGPQGRPAPGGGYRG